MNRKTAREIAVELCFAAAANGVDTDELVDSFFSEEHYTTLGTEDELFSAKPDETQLAYIRTLTRLSREKAEELDDMIERYARGWKAGRISRTARAVLRIALCEILYMDDIPAAVAINEAVELDKGYDDAETVAFVNGVLGGFMRGEMAAEEQEKE
ncbi:MAG: transcription antitermination factor NusB [Oscillospiraceae bacterium]|nr:transcription antitermination factor NusB [Oscillospiraceae bacterium]